MLRFYGSDFSSAFSVQLQTFLSLFEGEEMSNLTIANILIRAKEFSTAEKEFLSEVCRLIHLVLVMPATNVVSERSFSSHRCIKTYLRSTMHQNRLNHLMIFYVHKHLTDALDIKSVAYEFVAGSKHRLTLFRKFLV